MVPPFIPTRYSPPGRRIRTPSGPAVHLHSLSAARKAYPDRELSRRLSSLVIRREAGVSGPRIVQRFILPPYPSQGRGFQTPCGPGVHLHSISATRKAYEEPEGSTRLSSLAIRRQEGVSGLRVVPPFIFTRHPPPGRRTGGPPVVQPSISDRYPPPERPVRTMSGPSVHLCSPSIAVKAFPDRERSSRSYSLAIRRQEGVSGPRMVQPLIFIRYPLSATGKAYPHPEWSIFTRHPPPGRRTGGPRVVQSSIFARYPPPEGPVRTLSDPGVHLYSPSTAVKASPDRARSSRSYSLAIRRQEGVSGPRMV